MKMFPVYPRYPINISHGEGSYIWDDSGRKYLDFYSGHGVVNIGHSNLIWRDSLKKQIDRIGFYSNSVLCSLQEQFAYKLGEFSGHPKGQLFLCNSGSEAVENALKIAMISTGRKKIICFDGAFHGRSGFAIHASDQCGGRPECSLQEQFVRLPFNDREALENLEGDNDLPACIILEGMQGISGIYPIEDGFAQQVQKFCRDTNTLLILDEVQSGYGRSGAFFAFQHHPVLEPDFITVAKSMGNGFPIGGVIISEKIEATLGLLGSTFGGNHLACAAGIAVLDVLERENLIDNAKTKGKYLLDQLREIPEITEIRGRGLMVGLQINEEINVTKLRKLLVHEFGVFVGSAQQRNTIRLLPPLCIQNGDIDLFSSSLKMALEKIV